MEKCVKPLLISEKVKIKKSDSIDGNAKHYAKQNKPGSERQIPYDLTFNRNLINKTNKQAKCNQRH